MAILIDVTIFHWYFNSHFLEAYFPSLTISLLRHPKICGPFFKKGWLLIFILLTFRNFLHIMGNSLGWPQTCNPPTLASRVLELQAFASMCHQKPLLSMNSSWAVLFFFSPQGYIFSVTMKKLLSNSRSLDFCPCYLLGVWELHFMFMSVIHFKLSFVTFIWCLHPLCPSIPILFSSLPLSFFHVDFQLFCIICWKRLSCLHCTDFCFFCKNQLIIFTWVCFWALHINWDLWNWC